MNLTKYSRLKKIQEGTHLLVYTFQDYRTLSPLIKKGHLTGNKEFALPWGEGWSFLAEKYEWMQGHMKKRIKGYTGELPIWAHIQAPAHNIDGAKKYGEGTVLITAKIPLSRVLLSDFSMWECVMNGWYLADTIKEANLDISDKLKPRMRDRIRSWKKIFDLEPHKNKRFADYMYGEDHRKGRYIQACIDRIYLEDIIKIKTFDDKAKIPKKLKHLIV
jgi:hypothetical protein